MNRSKSHVFHFVAPTVDSLRRCISKNIENPCLINPRIKNTNFENVQNSFKTQKSKRTEQGNLQAYLNFFLYVGQIGNVCEISVIVASHPTNFAKIRHILAHQEGEESNLKRKKRKL